MQNALEGPREELSRWSLQGLPCRSIVRVRSKCCDWLEGFDVTNARCWYQRIRGVYHGVRGDWQPSAISQGNLFSLPSAKTSPVPATTWNPQGIPASSPRFSPTATRTHPPLYSALDNKQLPDLKTCTSDPEGKGFWISPGRTITSYLIKETEPGLPQQLKACNPSYLGAEIWRILVWDQQR
jgi:hypothetical protein